MPVILIVEDNPDNRVIYATLLRYSGYVVLEAEDGVAGVELATAELPDLILMDWSLPKMDGLRATMLLKEQESTKHIPVMMLTAHAMSDERRKAEEAGCDGYLTKPVEPRVVMEAVQKMLDARGS